MENIVALSTPVGRSAVAVVRMSGDDVIEKAKKIFFPWPKNANELKVGTLKTALFEERAMCVYFCAPHSYTGENMVEFHCHGGVAVPEAVVSACMKAGARMALNGEFSKRAFINGKQNLTNAEGIIDMIDAETMSAAKAGSALMRDELGKRVSALQDRLKDIICTAEAALDYPEENLESTAKEEVTVGAAKIAEETERLLSTSNFGKMVKYGITAAIVGAPNVGKSSLLNALTNSDRAIVSAREGTTRDTLDASVLYRDTKLNFTDTAGLRDAKDELECEGIRRAQAAAADADVVIYVTDTESEELPRFDKPCLKVFNKCDVVKYSDKANGIKVSAKFNIGTESVKEKIYEMFLAGASSDGFVLTNARHADCLIRAAKLLRGAVIAAGETTMDCVSQQLSEAWAVFGEITGSSANEEIIDGIFSKFCLGK